MYHRVTIAIASLCLFSAQAVAANPQMTAGEFLSRAEPMLKKSKMALIFSKDARTLMGILQQTAQANRARLEADRAAGRRVDTCLPAKGKAKINANDLLAHIRAMPPAQKAQSFDAALAGYTARKYPCRT